MATIVKRIVANFGAPTNGTSDATPAFSDFYEWLRDASQPGDLNILDVTGAQEYHAITSSGVAISNHFFEANQRRILIAGDNTLFGDAGGTGAGFHFGCASGSCGASIAVPQDYARCETTLRGSRQIVLKLLADAAIFSVGEWVWMAGLDLQAGGFPQSQAFIDFGKIIDITGKVVTIDRPLRYTYKDSWPHFLTGAALYPDHGGPATLFKAAANWDMDFELRGIIIDHNRQTHATARSMTLRNCGSVGEHSFLQTGSRLWRAIDFSAPAGGWEIDKLVDTVILDRVTLNGLFFQTAVPETLIMRGCTIGSMNGSAKRTYISEDCVLGNGVDGQVRPGAYAYGVSEVFQAKDSRIENLQDISGIHDKGGSGDPGFNVTYDMVGGVIIVPNTGSPPAWAVPGANFSFYGQHDFSTECGQVVDITADVNFIYVITTLTGTFPSIPPTTGSRINLRIHPAPFLSFENVTGSANAVDHSRAAARGKPMNSTSGRTYTKANLHNSLGPTLWGRLGSGAGRRIIINVFEAYAGSETTLLFKVFGQFRAFALDPDNTSSDWNAVINLKEAGIRTIDADGVSGLKTGDDIPAPGAIMFAGDQSPFCNHDISAEGGASCQVTVEVEGLDQGVVLATRTATLAD